MICPNCKQETSSLFRNCEHCKADLEEYRSKLNKSYELTEDRDSVRVEPRIMRLGSGGGFILIVFALVWFFTGLSKGIIYYYPPILLVIGIIAFVAGLKKEKRRKEIEEETKDIRALNEEGK